VFSVASVSILYNEDPRSAEIELKECLETAEEERLRRNEKKKKRERIRL
jgi:hypothetical protein